MTKNKFFVTTPIYYINDVPHIGHAYATFAADILARYHQQIEGKTFLLTGSDENSQKTVEAAQKRNLPVEKYAEEMAKTWQETWRKLNIADGQFGFVRTTGKNHERFVQEVFQKIHDAGFIEQGVYKGLYCVGHEAFVKNEDLDEKGLCPDHKTKPEILEEKNYFFKLKDFEEKLKGLYEKGPDFIQPIERRNEVTSFVARGLENISISREKARWGIKVPFDESQRIYVWFDALLSYYSGSPKEFWPADVHIIGKDILRFHAVIWPAMLIGYGEHNLPTNVPANQYVTFKGSKASKSMGVGKSIGWYADRLEPDALRFAIASVLPEQNDTDLTDDEIVRRINEELVATWGNLVNRVLTIASRNFDGKVPSPGRLAAEDQQIVDGVDGALTDIAALIDRVELKAGLRAAMDAATTVNVYLNATEPWKLLKTDLVRAGTVLWTAIQAISGLRVGFSPYLPFTTGPLGEMLGLGPELSEWARPELAAGSRLGQISPLFKKLEDDIIANDT